MIFKNMIEPTVIEVIHNETLRTVGKFYLPQQSVQFCELLYQVEWEPEIGLISNSVSDRPLIIAAGKELQDFESACQLLVMHILKQPNNLLVAETGYCLSLGKTWLYRHMGAENDLPQLSQ